MAALVTVVLRQMGVFEGTDETAAQDYHAEAHEMDIDKRYFDLMASGQNTTEILVNDSSHGKITEGDLMWFCCRKEEVRTRVTRVACYTNFEKMFDHESGSSENPTATREDQLANIRQIYPPEHEALGVVAIGIKLVDSPR